MKKWESGRSSFGGREKLWPVFLNEAQRSVHDRNTSVWGSLMMKSTALLHVHVWLKLVQSSSSQVNLAAFFSRWVKMPSVCVWSLEPFQTFMLMFGSNKQEISEVFSWVRLCWFVDSNIKAGQQHEPSSEKTQWKQRHLLDTYCGHMWWCRCCSLLSHF